MINEFDPGPPVNLNPMAPISPPPESDEQAALRASALAKLAAIGLSPGEIAALISTPASGQIQVPFLPFSAELFN